MCLAANPLPFVQCGLGEQTHKNSFFFSLGKRGGGRAGVNEFFFQPFLNSVLFNSKELLIKSSRKVHLDKV